tara:strand:+ start:476 stop:790 length:315 start_codon:yes stop_codon:yes gene_type:complete
MKKIAVFVLIFSLVISTSIIKNSTKDIDDEIYSIKEDLVLLENRFQDSKLEYDYLSSSEKLLEYQKLYFEKLLRTKLLKEISVVDVSKKELIFNKLTISGKNEK